MKKRDLSTTIGLICGVAAILISMMWGQDDPIKAMKAYWDVPSVFITVIGSFMSIVICFPPETLKRVPAALHNAFISKEVPADELITQFVELSRKARKEGLLSLENEIENIDDDFLKTGIQMVVDGIEPETIKEILELEIDETERRHDGPINVFKTWSSLAPAYGMLGTLIGLIAMLRNLNDQAKLGPMMSVALITSFYGSIMSNLVFLPLANKLQIRSDEETNRREMMIDGIISIQSGVNPRIVEEKLKTYLSPDERVTYLKQNADGNEVNING